MRDLSLMRKMTVEWSITHYLVGKTFCCIGSRGYFCAGELAEWSIAAVLKTVDCNRSGGSNPSLSAFAHRSFSVGGFFICGLLRTMSAFAHRSFSVGGSPPKLSRRWVSHFWASAHNVHLRPPKPWRRRVAH
jgi:hypothetical protein